MSKTAPFVPPAARRGATIVLATASLFLIILFAALAVDWGRVAVAKMELRSATEAAALAAVQQAGTAANMEAAATAVAAENRVAGTPLTLVAASDIEFGTWDTPSRSFTVLSGTARDGANAVRVTGRRTAARGTGLPLIFGQALGQTTFDLARRSTVAAKPGDYCIVGLDFITLNGNGTMSYHSGGTAVPANKGSAASNGNINLYASSYIDGDARPGIGKSVVGGAGRVSGSMAPLTSPLVYPIANGTPYRTANDNGALSLTGNDLVLTKVVHVPGGTYYVRNLQIDGAGGLTLNGPTTFYVYGAFTNKGVLQTYDSVPSNLTINMIRDPSTGTIGLAKIESNAAFHGILYGPESVMTFAGNGAIYGRLVGKSVTFSGGSNVYFDMATARGTGASIVE